MNRLVLPRALLRLLALLLVVIPLGLATRVTHGATVHTDAARHTGPALSKPLGSPTDIEVGGAGNSFVSDWAYHRILKFSPTGKHLAQMLAPAGLKLPGIYINGFKFTGFLPEYLALDAKGQLYATANRYQVLKFSTSGKLLAHWVVPGAHGIAVDGQGNVYVSQWSDAAGVDGGVVKLSPAGKKLARWDTLAKLSGPVHHLGGLQIDSAGNVYVADFSHDQIEKLSPSGELLTTLGPSIEGYKAVAKNAPGTTVNVLGCACDVELDRAGDVYVNDAGSMQYLKLSPAGALLTTYSNPRFTGPFALDAGGNLYVASGNVLKVSPSGQILATWR